MKSNDPGEIEVIMNPGMNAVLSLPVGWRGTENLVVINQHGTIQTSRFNPATNMIDAVIHASGIFQLHENTAEFSDIYEENPVVQTAITRLASRGIMQGNDNDEFRPGELLTLQELHHALAVIASYQNIVLATDEVIRRDQLASQISDFLMDYMGYHVPENANEILENFADRAIFPDWAEGGIALLTEIDLLPRRTDNRFEPGKIMTRADAAWILYRLYRRVW